MDMTKITDPLIKLEKSYPFYRMHITTFLNKINSMGKDEIEIDLLGKMFDTPAWEGKFAQGQELHTLLMSLPESSEGTVKVGPLSLLALLWCRGEFKDKAEVLFQQLNPPGQNQDGISANDKDWDQVFDRLVYLASFWTQEQAKRSPLVNDTIEEHYEETLTNRAIKAFRLSEEEDNVEHMGFIMRLFGYESRLSKEDYLHAICEVKCNFVFNASGIRENLSHFTNEDVCTRLEGDYA